MAELPTPRIFDPDTSLITQWSKAAAKAAPLPAPYVAGFEAQGAQLRYIAARHNGDIDSPTLKTVKAAFDDFRPQVVIVEGVPNEGAASPGWYLEYARQKEQDGFKSGGGETAYAATLAAGSGIDFVPAEPTEGEKLTGLLARGYSAADYMGWSIAQLAATHPAINDENADEIINRNIASTARRAGIDPGGFDATAFKAWYEDKTGTSFAVATAKSEDLSPDRNGSALQKLTQAVDDVREPHIVKTIAAQMEKFDRVLVVYGSAHLVKQEPALRQMLGKPQYIKPF
jgi:hypothetical protein